MHHTRALATALLMTAIAAPMAAAGPPRRPVETAMTLRAATSGELAGIEMLSQSAAAVAPRRAVVTDLVVRLRPASGEGRIETLLELADGDRAGRNRVLFTTELLVVANGRLLVEERAACSPWRSGASLCRTECDGGTFAIMRRQTPRGLALSVLIGQVDAAEPGSVKLGACSDGAGDETALAPRRGQARAEVALRAE